MDYIQQNITTTSIMGECEECEENSNKMFFFAANLVPYTG